MPRRAGEHDRVAEERLERDASVPPCRADDAELEVAGGDSLDDRLRVEDPERDVARGAALRTRREAARHDPAGARRRAELERARQLVAALERDLGDELLLEREQALCAR